jgi:hypothetical protein
MSYLRLTYVDIKKDMVCTVEGFANDLGHAYQIGSIIVSKDSILPDGLEDFGDKAPKYKTGMAPAD